MNIPQQSVAQYFTELILGMLVYATETRDQISRTAKGIIYFGRAVVRCKLAANVDNRGYPMVRLPRQNKYTQAFSGAMSAGTVRTVLATGKITSGNVTEATTNSTISTAWITDLATTLAAHAQNIAAAMADCVSCAYANGTLTYKGDADDIYSVTTTFLSAGSGDTAAAAAAALTTGDTAADVLGVAFLTSDRQQQLSTGYNYYLDTEAVNILQKGSVAVMTEVAVSESDAIYVRLITNTNGWAGNFRNDSDSNTAVLMTGMEWLKTQSAAGLEPLKVNFPR